MRCRKSPSLVNLIRRIRNTLAAVNTKTWHDVYLTRGDRVAERLKALQSQGLYLDSLPLTEPNVDEDDGGDGADDSQDGAHEEAQLCQRVAEDELERARDNWKQSQAETGLGSNLAPRRPAGKDSADVATRWTSTLAMLSRVQSRVAEINDVVREEELKLSDSDVRSIKALIVACKPMEWATEALQAEAQATLGTCWYTYRVLMEIYSGKVEGELDVRFLPSAVGEFVVHLMAELHKLWRTADQLDPSSHLATALDPRYKQLTFLEPAERDAVRATLRAVFEKERAVQQRGSGAPAPKRRRIEPDEAEEDDEVSPTLGERVYKGRAEDELDAYERQKSLRESSHPLPWWSREEKAYPTLARLARRYLAMPAKTVLSEEVRPRVEADVSEEFAVSNAARVGKATFIKHNLAHLARLGVSME